VKAVKKRKAGSTKTADGFQALLKDLRENMEEGAVRLASEGFDSDVKMWIPTGFTQLDVLLKGGIPVGRIVEIYGREGSGKTTLATQIMASCQRMGGVAILLDSESKFYPERAKLMGVDLNQLLTVRANTVEKGFAYILQILPKAREHMAADLPVVVVWDTIASAPTEAEFDAQTEGDDPFKRGMMEKPRIIKQAMRVGATLLSQTQVSLVLINQIMETQHGDRPPGGTGIRHQTSARIQMYRTGEEGAEVSLQARIRKLQLDGPQSGTDRVDLVIRPHGGADHVSMLEYLATQKACAEITKSGGWYTIGFNGTDHKAQRSTIEQKVMEVDGLSDFLKDRTTFYMLGMAGYEQWKQMHSR